MGEDEEKGREEATGDAAERKRQTEGSWEAAEGWSRETGQRKREIKVCLSLICG